MSEQALQYIARVVHGDPPQSRTVRKPVCHGTPSKANTAYGAEAMSIKKRTQERKIKAPAARFPN
jgi:hypothetical protein